MSTRARGGACCHHCYHDGGAASAHRYSLHWTHSHYALARRQNTVNFATCCSQLLWPEPQPPFGTPAGPGWWPCMLRCSFQKRRCALCSCKAAPWWWHRVRARQSRAAAGACRGPWRSLRVCARASPARTLHRSKVGPPNVPGWHTTCSMQHTQQHRGARGVAALPLTHTQ